MNRHLRFVCLPLTLAVAGLFPVVASALSVTSQGWAQGDNTHYFGPAKDQTCFLNGISGNLIGATVNIFNTLPGEFGSDPIWLLGTLGRAKGIASCIEGTSSPCPNSVNDNVPGCFRDFFISSGGGGEVSGKTSPVAPNRHCFLSGVWAGADLVGPWLPGNANLGIIQKDGVFRFGIITEINQETGVVSGSDVNLLTPNFGAHPGLTVGARCKDFLSEAELVGTFSVPTTAATETFTLRNKDGSPVPVAGVACFLIGIGGGNWYSDQIGLSDGVFLTGDPKKSNFWEMTVSKGHSGVAQCFK